MPKEFSLMISIGEGKFSKIADEVGGEMKDGENKIGKLDARMQVLNALIFGIKKRVSDAVCQAFPATANIAVKDITEENVHDLQSYLASLDPAIRATPTVFDDDEEVFTKKVEKKAKKERKWLERKKRKRERKGKLRREDWLPKALFNHNTTEPSSLAGRIYARYFETNGSH